MDTTDTTTPPTGTDWERDGIARSHSGNIVIRMGELTVMEVTREYLIECLQIRRKHEQEIADLQCAMSAREPARFLPQVITELESRGDESGKLRNEGAAGKIVWGQAQAYRDSAALIRASLPKS